MISMAEPDFEHLDGLVHEYVTYRQEEKRRQTDGQQGAAQYPGSTVVDRIMKAFDCGDYPNSLSLWDSYVTQALDPADPVQCLEADVAEFYMHLHCATCPFRSAMMSMMAGPRQAAELAARSMTIFKHYLSSKGRNMLSSPEFKDYKNLHKIAFPPTHPKFSHIFKQEWISSTREKFFKFLIPFVRSQHMPRLCRMVSLGADTFQSLAGGGDGSLVNASKTREKHFQQQVKDMYSAITDFVDGIDERTRMVDGDALADMQNKIKQWGRAAHPATPPLNGGHRRPSLEGTKRGDMGGDAADSIHSTGTTRSQVKKTKITFDFTMVKVDLKHAFSVIESSFDATSAVPDWDVSSGLHSAAMQGSLLLTAVRSLLLTPGSFIKGEHESMCSIEKLLVAFTSANVMNLTSSEPNIRSLPSLLENFRAVANSHVVEEGSSMLLFVNLVEAALAVLATLGLEKFGLQYIELAAGDALFESVVRLILNTNSRGNELMMPVYVFGIAVIALLCSSSKKFALKFIMMGGLEFLSRISDQLVHCHDMRVSAAYTEMCVCVTIAVATDTDCRDIISDSGPEVIAQCGIVTTSLLGMTLYQLDESNKPIASDLRIGGIGVEEVVYLMLKVPGVAARLHGSDEYTSFKNQVDQGAKTADVSLSIVHSVETAVENDGSEGDNAKKVRVHFDESALHASVVQVVKQLLHHAPESALMRHFSLEHPAYADDATVLEKYKQSSAAATGGGVAFRD